VDKALFRPPNEHNWSRHETRKAAGALTTVTGLVSALSAYQLLTHLDVPKSSKGNVMLVLFNGKTYDRADPSWFEFFSVKGPLSILKKLTKPLFGLLGKSMEGS
jgi:hypothetical protein